MKTAVKKPRRNKSKKVNVKIDHPDFQCDATMTESKALTFVKRMKKSLEKNIKVEFKVIENA